MNLRPLAICTLVLAHSAPAATTDDYAYAWPLQTTGDSAAWQVDLTPEVYAAVRSADLRDIEVVNAAGEAVPMAPRGAQLTAVATNEVELPAFGLPTLGGMGPNDDNLQLLIERDVNGRLRQFEARVPLDAESRDDKVIDRHIVVDARALKEAAIDSLWLSWDESGNAATARFDVSGSDDLQQWRVLNANASVLAMQQNGNSLSQRQIALGGVHAKFLQLRRLDNGAPLSNLRIRARTSTPSLLIQPEHVWVDAHAQPASAIDRHSASGFDYQLPAPLAVDALKLELADDNSLARLQVRSRMRAGDDANAWQTRADFTAFRLRQGDSIAANDEIAVSPGARAQDWYVDPATPLDRAPTLRVAYRPDRFMFLAQGNGPYRLVAGSARARRGDYPIDAALAQLRGKFGADWQPPLAALGTRTTLQGESVLVAAAPARDWKTWILWTVLIGAAVLIGGLALSLLRAQGPPE